MGQWCFESYKKCSKRLCPAEGEHDAILINRWQYILIWQKLESISICLPCCQLWEYHRDEKRVSDRHLACCVGFPRLRWCLLILLLASWSSQMLCHRVLSLNSGHAIPIQVCLLAWLFLLRNLTWTGQQRPVKKLGALFGSGFFHISYCRESFLRLRSFTASYIPRRTLLPYLLVPLVISHTEIPSCN